MSKTSMSNTSAFVAVSLKILGYLDLEKHKHTKKFEKKDNISVMP